MNKSDILNLEVENEHLKKKVSRERYNKNIFLIFLICLSILSFLIVLNMNTTIKELSVDNIKSMRTELQCLNDLYKLEEKYDNLETNCLAKNNPPTFIQPNCCYSNTCWKSVSNPESCDCEFLRCN